MKYLKTSNLNLFNNYNNLNGIVPFLSLFLDPQKQLLNKEITGLKAKSQKKLNKVVKTSRKLGILPFYISFVYYKFQNKKKNKHKTKKLVD